MSTNLRGAEIPISRKLNALLSSGQKKQLIILACLLIVGIIFEMLGLGILLPAITLMVKPDIGSAYPAIRPLLNALGNPSHGTLLTLGMLSLVVLYVVKSLFLVYITWRQTKFNSELSADLAQRLFHGYMTQPYEFHLERNSAKLMSNIQSEVALLQTAGQAVMVLLTELSLFVSVVFVLVLVEPVGAISVTLFLGITGYIFYKLTKSRLKTWGVRRLKHAVELTKHLLQGLGGVKDVKLLGRERYFLREVTKNYAKITDINIKHTTLQQVPRFYLEVLAVTGLASLVIVSVFQAKPVDNLIPVLGLFIAAAFRMIPSANRIMGSVQTIQFVKPAVNALYEEFQIFARNETAKSPLGGPIDFSGEIAVHDLTLQYANASTEALKGVTLSIIKGETVGFIGPSGSGKSTLVDIILGLLKPSSGAVIIDGLNIQDGLRSWQDQLGYVPQTIYLTDDSLRRNIAFGLSDDEIEEESVKRAVRSAQLEEFVDDLPEGLDTVVGERGVRLSGGQRQRIGIARALYNNPSVLILDEATSALDTKTEHEVMKAILSFKGEKTVLIIAHRLSTVENCDRIYKLASGKITATGTPENVLSIK